MNNCEGDGTSGGTRPLSRLLYDAEASSQNAFSMPLGPRLDALPLSVRNLWRASSTTSCSAESRVVPSAQAMSAVAPRTRACLAVPGAVENLM